MTVQSTDGKPLGVDDQSDYLMSHNLNYYEREIEGNPVHHIGSCTIAQNEKNQKRILDIRVSLDIPIPDIERLVNMALAQALNTLRSEAAEDEQ